MDLNDMNIEKNADYNKVATVQGQVNALRVESMKNCYEALIEYVITHGANNDTSRAGKILALFVRHKDLTDLIAKSGAAAAKKKAKKDDTIAKAKAAPPPNFILPEHAYSLKALSVTLHMILM